MNIYENFVGFYFNFEENVVSTLEELIFDMACFCGPYTHICVFIPLVQVSPKNAAKYIVEKRQVYGVCVDGPSLDAGQNAIFDVHRTLFEAQIFGTENLNLEWPCYQVIIQISLRSYSVV